ncbi:transposase [Nannocystis pusilla]|uniref:Transposase n=1 Tax=Nannocystis pusilla TaxID=889268 RepID=A0ABS7TNF8_9BACT|nr:transposase [Nannocystis pusilla]
MIVRGDSGFCRDEVMRWYEDNGLFFVLGLQKNSRLIAEIEDEMKQARALSEQTGKNAPSGDSSAGSGARIGACTSRARSRHRSICRASDRDGSPRAVDLARALFYDPLEFEACKHVVSS